jgi:hypothetical protein
MVEAKMGWHALTAIVIFFGLSFIGIVIGWLSWDQDGHYGKHVLAAGSISTVLLTLASAVAILVAASIVLMFGAHAFPLAVGAGLGTGVLIFFMARAQVP